MKIRSNFILFIILISILPLAAAAVPEEDCLYYFYGKECQSCSEVDTLLERIQNQYPKVKIERFESYHNQENAQLLQKYFTAYNIPKESQGVPILFVSRSYLIGSKSITDLSEERLLDNKGKDCPSLEPGGAVGIVGEKEPKHIIETLTFSAVISAAFHDSLTPVALLFPLVLFGIIIFIRDINKHLFKKNLVFVAGIFISFFLYGVGFLFHLGKGIIIPRFIALIAFLGSLFHIIQFFTKKKIKLFSFSEETMKQIEKVRKQVLSFYGIFIAGFIVSIFTFAVFGKVFKLLVEFSRHSYTNGIALPLLIFFLIIFILPTLITAVALHYIWDNLVERDAERKVKSDQEREKIKNHTKKVFYFGLNVAAAILSLLILFL